MGILSLTGIVTALLSSLLDTLALHSQPFCKPDPSSPNWPSAPEWHALNESLSGRLLSPVPPGIVCQPDHPSFNNQSCMLLRTQWANSSFKADNPFLADYNDDTCLPDPRAPCSAAGYPVYVVNATSVADVQAGVRFAKKTGVRLIVKGTGHDFPGRSSGANSLSVWTHHLRGISVNRHDARAEKHGGVASVKIAAGMRMFEIYATAVQHNITVVGGSDPNVGVGGWITGGGHSPISSKYGLGADQVLEMDVVTADGTFLRINEHSYPDLFWAMRGGGGSTFAVLTSVTVRAFPSTPATLSFFSYNTTANSDTFWSLAAYFHSQLPSLSNNSVMGYYYVYADTSAAEPNPALRGKVYGLWIIPEHTAAQADAIISPIEEALGTFNWSDPVSVSRYAREVPDFISAWLLQIQPEPVGFDGRLGSRLLDGEALSSDLGKIRSLLKQATPIPQLPSVGHLVAGPGVRNVDIPGGSNAVNPAWRNAYVHLVLPRIWDYLNTTHKAAVTTSLREIQVQALRELAPNSGAYVNEADPTEPNWEQTFWGSNYPRLLRLKNKWDPDGVFWCKPCVGHGEWTVTGDDGGIESGIGQTGGTICRARPLIPWPLP